ncbi:hypothetical protein F0562_029420 [Nyssa sinensis]|uniref:Uncharacterized protein n=1 Tax=Nyssa sinensis TaxID=561372 RepID=A0A5J5B4Z8_9ASTE|nr:hypothetical protein F0562_029420 [Nyssa sinensis]
MAGYGYPNRGYTTYQGTEPRADDWSKSSYGRSGYSDQVQRPVIMDAEGRKRPIVGYIPNNSESYGTSERIVEYVQAPAVVADYKFGSPTKDYGVVNSTKWRRPSSPVYDHPQKVEQFMTTTVQTQVSRPARTGFSSTTNWRNAPTSTAYGQGYGEYDWSKPSGNVIRDDSYGDYYRRNDQIIKEPTLITKDGWERQSAKGWAAQPSHDTPLSKPTNNVGEAVNLLKEAAQSLSVSGAAATPQTQFGLPVSAVPKPVVGSVDAARRYGNFNLGTRTFRTGETYRNY